MKKMTFLRHKSVWKVVALVAIVIGVNLLVAYVPGRIDISQDQRFSISPSTREIISGLGDPVSIKAYFSKKLPPRAEPALRQIRDILSEYQAASRGNVIVQYIDPDEDEEARSQALAYGIPKLQFEVASQDQLQVQGGYLGILVSYADKRDVIPAVQNATRLEYDLTTLILRLSQKNQRVIGFLQGFATHPIDQASGDIIPYTSLVSALKRIYEVKSVEVTDEAPLITGIDTLVIAGAEGLTDKALFAVDQFLTGGGKAIFLDDALKIGRDLTVRETSSGLEKILAPMGIAVGKSVVLDRLNEFASFQTAEGQLIQSYPYFVKLVSKNFSRENPVLASFDSIVLPWASPLILTDREGWKHEVLAKTEDGWSLNPPYNFDPKGVVLSEDVSHIPMVVMAVGKYTSVFTEGAVPGENETRVMVVGDSDFTDDMFVRRFNQNGAFMMNVIDAFTLSDQLISIRSKLNQEQAMLPLSISEKTFLKFIGIWLIPIVVVVSGAWHLVSRARRKNSFVS